MRKKNQSLSFKIYQPFCSIETNRHIIKTLARVSLIRKLEREV